MDRLKHIVINHLTKKLLKAVTAEEILAISGKEWLLRGRKLSAEEILLLKEEAESFHKSDLWKLILSEVKYRATIQRFDQARTADDMVFGKAMAYSIDLIDKFVLNVRKL